MWYCLWDRRTHGMKPTGPHPHKKLNPPAVAALSEPGRYSDGNGLYLVVGPKGNKKWVLRTMVHGKRRDIGLGGLSTTSLKKARETAADMRWIARDGGDPIEEFFLFKQVAKAADPADSEGARARLFPEFRS